MSEGAKAKTFQDLEVWKLAHQWVLSVYKMTESFPKHEVFGLTSQLRRAAVSVPGNLAEGFKRASPAEKARFYNISQASLEESRYYPILARDLGYAETERQMADLDRISRMLDSYIQKIIASTC
jgi:four helix bundle protein